MNPDPLEQLVIDLLRKWRCHVRSWWCNFLCPDKRGMSFMAFSIVESTTVNATVKFRKPNGQPARVDGVPVWASEPGLTLTPAADGMSCAVAADALPDGTFTKDLQVTCTGDADLGPGVRSLMLTGVLTVTAAEATGGDITFAAPTP